MIKKMDCPECGGIMILKNSSYGKFYGCINYPKCRMTHGAHPSGAPLGLPANLETRILRHKVHVLCDEIWDYKSKKQRKQMYIWLKENTSMGHIGMLLKNELLELIKKLKYLKIYL